MLSGYPDGGNTPLLTVPFIIFTHSSYTLILYIHLFFYTEMILNIWFLYLTTSRFQLLCPEHLWRWNLKLYLKFFVGTFILIHNMNVPWFIYLVHNLYLILIQHIMNIIPMFRSLQTILWWIYLKFISAYLFKSICSSGSKKWNFQVKEYKCVHFDIAKLPYQKVIQIFNPSTNVAFT